MWLVCITLAHLIALDTHVMAGDEGLEHDHPAGIGGSLKQRVSHLRDVHVGGVGGRHQVCKVHSHREMLVFTQWFDNSLYWCLMALRG